jgi:hypothetical protein
MLSPQDELFPSDVFSSDFDFVIEAPDFPFGSKDEPMLYIDKNERLQPRKSHRASSPKPSPKDTISPIKEEKIRPIPPPWI